MKILYTLTFTYPPASSFTTALGAPETPYQTTCISLHMPLSLSTLPSILLLLFHGTFTYPSTQASYSREDFQYLAGWVRSLHCAFSATSCALPNYTTHSAILYLFIYLGLVPDHELTQGRECTSTFISLPPSPMPNSNGSQ